MDLNPECLKSNKILENFAEFHLLNNNNNSQIFIHDIIGFVHQEGDESEENENNSEDSLSSENGEKNKNYIKKNKSLDKSFDINENYFCFILDNFNGVYMNIYDINNSYNYNDEENAKEENDLKNYSYYDQIFNLYKNYYKDLPYVPIGEENKNIYTNDKDGFESEKGFGYIKINETDKKMFEIDSKRNLFEEVVKAYERKDKNPLINLSFLSKEKKEEILDTNSRKVSVNSVDSDISMTETQGISKEDYENIKEIIDKFNLEKNDKDDDKSE